MNKENKPERTDSMGTLIIIRGIPGSGKSYFAEKLIEIIGHDTVRIDPDDYRYKNDILDNLQNTDHDTFYNTLNNIASESLKLGKIVIWEQAWTSLKSAKDVQTEVEEVLHPDRFLIIEIETSEDIAWERIKTREGSGKQRGPNREKFNSYVERYVSLKNSIPEEELILFDGRGDIKRNMEIVLAWLRKAMVI